MCYDVHSLLSAHDNVLGNSSHIIIIKTKTCDTYTLDTILMLKHKDRLDVHHCIADTVLDASDHIYLP